MNMFFIVLLVVLGVLFLVAELVLLPGVSVGALLSIVCYGGAIYLAFGCYGTTAGIVVCSCAVLSALVATFFSLRARTWQRFSLHQELDAASAPLPENELRPGDRGTTLSRLSPMGKVEIRGRIYEAKSQGLYVDPRVEVEVVGFENASVVVRTVDNQQSKS